jgi:hypothetical protein
MSSAVPAAGLSEGYPVADGKRVDVEGDQFGGAGGRIEGAEPEVAAVEVVVVVVPGPRHEAVDVAGAGDLLGEDVDGGDVRRVVTEDENLTGVADRGLGAFARRAAGRTLRPALAAGGGQHGHPKAAHAGQQSSSREP